jgi:hypothetical protein
MQNQPPQRPRTSCRAERQEGKVGTLATFWLDGRADKLAQHRLRPGAVEVGVLPAYNQHGPG